MSTKRITEIGIGAAGLLATGIVVWATFAVCISIVVKCQESMLAVGMVLALVFAIFGTACAAFLLGAVARFWYPRRTRE